MTPIDAQTQADLITRMGELVVGRRSIRRYLDQPIDREVIERILEWANWAPSAHNRQPWRFCVVTDTAVKKRLAEQMSERWLRDLRADGAEEEDVQRRISASRLRLTSAAALLMVSMSMEDADTYTDDSRRSAEYTMFVQSTALACQNLLLAAHAHGLGACWMCAPLFVSDLVRSILDLPDSWEPQALITLGYSAEVRTSEREPVQSRIIWR